MFIVRLDDLHVLATRYKVVREEDIAHDMAYNDAYTIVKLLNQQAESKTPTGLSADQKTEQDTVNRELASDSSISSDSRRISNCMCPFCTTHVGTDSRKP